MLVISSGLAGQPQKAEYKEYSRSSYCQASGCVTADGDDLLVQGSGKHGIVSSLLAGMGQASGRVDVPASAKIEAAAACPGTSRIRPGNADALGSVRSRGPKTQFF